MALTVPVRRYGPALYATDALGEAELRELPSGAELKAVITKPKGPRSVQQHRLLFAMLTLVVDNLDQPISKDALLEWIKLKLGHVELIRLRNGDVVEVPKSIAFDAMDQADFRSFFDGAADLLCEHIIPGLGKPDLERHAREMLGEPEAA